MFLVILGHTHLCEQQIVVKQAIYSFHMPLFFFLSGLLCKSTLSVRSLLKDARFLLLPYLFYGLLAIAAGVLFSGRLSAGDIAAGLGQMKRPGQLLVGFALETNDEVAHAQDKLRRKNFDFIVLNSLNDKGAGFQHDTNKVTIITPQEALPYPLKPKTEVACDIIDQLEKRF
jgi:hypothetical protein